MNLYFLLEGRRSEAMIYPSWLASIDRPFKRMMAIDDVIVSPGRSFFCFSANGYPSIVGGHLKNAISDIKKFPGYDWLIVCLDVDESTSDDRIREVEEKAKAAGLGTTATRLFVVAQSRCIESWLLGNPRLIGDAPPPYLAELRDFYDIRRLCPERMGKPRSWTNHAQFHFHYVREAFKAKHMCYTKSNPGDAATASYFASLRTRVERDPGCLPTFQRFVEFIEAI